MDQPSVPRPVFDLLANVDRLFLLRGEITRGLCDHPGVVLEIAQCRFIVFHCAGNTGLLDREL